MNHEEKKVILYGLNVDFNMETKKAKIEFDEINAVEKPKSYIIDEADIPKAGYNSRIRKAEMDALDNYGSVFSKTKKNALDVYSQGLDEYSKRLVRQINQLKETLEITKIKIQSINEFKLSLKE